MARSGSTAESSSALLVERAQEADVEAFTELVRQHQDRAYAVALTMLGDPGQAQDAVQDAFLTAFDNLGSLRAPQAFGAWLHQIVRHQASRLLRRRRHDSVLTPGTLSGSQDPADAAVRRDDLRRILRAIEALPESYREVTILFYLKDQSQKTVAALLGLPVTTVNNRLHGARQKLKGELLPLMQTLLSSHTLPADFAEAVGRIVRIEGSVADRVPTALAQLGAQASGTAPLETGIKVMDLLCPIAEGGTLGLFGDPRVGKLVLVEELAHNLRGRRGQPAIFTFIKAPEEVGVYTELLAEVGPLRTAVLAAEGATESALAAARPFLDAAVFMTRPLVEAGIYPAVDPQRSWSRLLNPAFVGTDHSNVARRVLAALRQVDEVGTLGSRARRIRNFLSQPFFSAEAYTRRPGAFVPREQAITAFKALLAGSHDDLPEPAFLMCGTLDDAIAGGGGPIRY